MATATPTGPSTHPLEIHSGITTSWLSMPTSWSNPPDCSTRYYAYDYAVGGYDVFDPILVLPGKASCQPDAVFTWWRQDILNGQEGNHPTSVSLWANNFNCPDAYTTASTYALDVSSTQIFCCPSAHDFSASFPHGSLGQCASPLTAGAFLTVYDTSSNWVAITGFVPHNTSVTGVPVNGWTFLQSPASSTATTSIAGQASTSIITSSSSSSNSSLSTGAKIGIGVGAGGVTLAIIAVVMCFLLWRRWNARNFAITDANSGNGIAQGDQSWAKNTSYSYSLPSTAIPHFQDEHHEMEQSSPEQAGPYEICDAHQP